jgi:ribonuclease P protein component
MRFRAEQRLRRQLDFRAARERGRRIECGGFTLWCHRRPAAALQPSEPSFSTDSPANPVPTVNFARVGVVASTAAVGKAVQRNRAKRRLREVFRRNQNRVPAEYDLLMVARRSLADMPLAEIERRFVEACEKIQGGKRP